MNTDTLLDREEYRFIKNNPRLGRNVILLGLGGSYSYGTSNEQSDIDIRGITLNLRSDLLGLTEFEQYTDRQTDTVIYSFNKMIKLLLECNPNTCEILGLNQEHYLILTPEGRELLDQKSIFLSKRAAKSFGGYASAQLRRLQNALARDSLPQNEKEVHILRSVQNALEDFERRYDHFESGSVRIYIDKAVNPEFETELFADVSLNHYPLRDYENMWSVMHNVVKDYDKLGKRNHKKDDNHLNKHAMHLIRLFMMGIDILRLGEIRTYRGEDLKLLTAIRRGEYRRKDGLFEDEFYEILSEYERKLEEAAAHSILPDEPDLGQVGAFMEKINERAVHGKDV